MSQGGRGGFSFSGVLQRLVGDKHAAKKEEEHIRLPRAARPSVRARPALLAAILGYRAAAIKPWYAWNVNRATGLCLVKSGQAPKIVRDKETAGTSTAWALAKRLLLQRLAPNLRTRFDNGRDDIWKEFHRAESECLEEYVGTAFMVVVYRPEKHEVKVFRACVERFEPTPYYEYEHCGVVSRGLLTWHGVENEDEFKAWIQEHLGLGRE